jgi:hypothetical protein
MAIDMENEMKKEEEGKTKKEKVVKRDKSVLIQTKNKVS